jgi:mannose-6-phosphate isomerase-like protein (cupin superfamily)
MEGTEGGAMGLLPVAEQDRQGEHVTFIGKAYESGVSFFIEAAGPGQGPALHRHPYSETFIVLDGEMTFTIGRDVIVAGPGDIAVAPAMAPHKFTNTGTGILRSVNIHAAEEMHTEWLDEETWDVIRESDVRA